MLNNSPRTPDNDNIAIGGRGNRFSNFSTYILSEIVSIMFRWQNYLSLKSCQSEYTTDNRYLWAILQISALVKLEVTPGVREWEIVGRDAFISVNSVFNRSFVLAFFRSLSKYK